MSISHALFFHLGWWFVDAQGMLGWCPASYLVPVEEDDIDGEKEENEAVIGKEKG